MVAPGHAVLGLLTGTRTVRTKGRLAPALFAYGLRAGAQIQPFSRLTITAWARSTTLSLWYTLCRWLRTVL